MATSLEIGKLVAASFIYQYWKIVNWIQKTYMMLAVVTLIGITSMGIFGFLSNSYMGATQEFQGMLTKLDVYKEQLVTLEEDKVFLKQELEASVTALPDNYITAKRKLREEYNPKIQEKSLLIVDLKTKIGEIEIDMVDTGVDVGPLIYISEQFDTDMDTVVGWIMLILICVFDPLAVVMIISWNIAMFGKRKEDEPTDYFKERNSYMEKMVEENNDRLDVIAQNGNDGLHYDEIEEDEDESFLEQKEKEDLELYAEPKPPLFENEEKTDEEIVKEHIKEKIIEAVKEKKPVDKTERTEENRGFSWQRGKKEEPKKEEPKKEEPKKEDVIEDHPMWGKKLAHKLNKPSGH